MDILPSFVYSMIMFCAVYAVQWLNLGLVLTLILQIISGVAVYAGISLIFKPVPFRMCMEVLEKRRLKKAGK
jgi:hypothetical protein